MIRKSLLIALCTLAVCPAFAQENSTAEETVEYSTDKYKVETNRFWSNWFISLGGGAQIYFGDHDKQASFGDRLAPALDVAVGKWFTPGIGVRLMYSGLKAKGATKLANNSSGEDVSHGTGTPLDGNKGTIGGGYELQYQKYSMGNFHADVLFNLSNLFCGYNPQRVWNISPYVGLGWARVYKSPNAKEVSANIGVLNSWRLCSALDLNLDVRGMFVNDRFDGEGGGRFGEGMLSATVGLAYKFKRRDWDRSKTIIRHHTSELNEIRDRLNTMTEENERLKRELAAANQKEAEVIVKRIAAANLVTFRIDKSDLSKEARANLGLLAEVIKSGDPDAVYTITGYADKGTGSVSRNEKLSIDRAQAVFDCLTKEFGVPEKQLRMEHKGGVDNMFYDDPRLSRAVITRGE